MDQLLREKWAAGMSYAAYRALIQARLAIHQTTGPNQTDELVHFTVLNEQRMRRIDKTVQLRPDLLALLTTWPHPQHWLVLTEGWCGDAAQILPVLAAMADQAPAIELRLLLRDDHLDLMDRYLTGTSRSIPKLIAIDAASGQELGQWGPRPAAAMALLRAAPDKPHSEVAQDLQVWYTRDKTAAIQTELMACLLAWTPGGPPVEHGGS
jgi:hypothetical protein